jgi:hypothetical protein
MKRFAFLSLFLVVFLALTSMTRFAHAAGQELRTCDFDLKGGCPFGYARVTLAQGAVTRVEVGVIWCNRQRGAPGYTCTIDSSRDDKESTWSDDAGAVVITDNSLSRSA